jgi:membrane protein YdbS with pleckstrin-like domain
VSTLQQSFGEQDLVTLRRHGSALVLPVLSLGLIAALFFFLDTRASESWQHQSLLGAALVLGLVFWLIPSIRYFSNRYVISTNRVVIHRGITGKSVDQVSWNEINGVSVTKGFLSLGGDIQLHREFGQDLVIAKVPKAKKLSRELEQYLASRSRTKSN